LTSEKLKRRLSENPPKEAESGVINLPEDEPEIVKLLIQYLYEGEYEPLLPDSESSIAPPPVKIGAPRPIRSPDGDIYSYNFPHTCRGNAHSYICPHHTCIVSTGSPYRIHSCTKRDFNNFNCEECKPTTPPLPSLNGKADQLLLHAKMYEYADKYDVSGLKDLAIEKFSRSCKHFWNKDEFSVAAHHVFSTTVDKDKGLRDIVSATISAHMELVKKPQVKVLMTEFNGLALGILEEKIIEHSW
jgi:hypothetical protein